jgi:hypothetical protein
MRDARAKQEKQEAKEQKKALAMERKKQIQEIWERTETGQEFLDELQYAGYGVAKGDRRTKHTELNQDGQLTKNRFVLIDQHGQVSNLSRDLPRLVKRADIADRLGELQHGLKSVEETRQEVIERQQFYDSEQAKIDRENRELAAMDKDAKEKARLEEQQRKEALLAEVEQKEQPPERRWDDRLGKSKHAAIKSEILSKKTPVLSESNKQDHKDNSIDMSQKDVEKSEEEPSPIDLAAAQSKKWRDIIDQDREDDAHAALFENRLRKEYNFEALEIKGKRLKESIAASDTFLGRRTGKYQKLKEEEANHEKYIEETKQRIQERVDAFKQDRIKERPPHLQPVNDDVETSEQEQEQSENIADFTEAAREKSAQVSKEEAFKKRMRQTLEEEEKDQSQGLDIDLEI